MEDFAANLQSAAPREGSSSATNLNSPTISVLNKEIDSIITNHNSEGENKPRNDVDKTFQTNKAFKWRQH